MSVISIVMPDALYFVGILFAVIATITFNVVAVLQKPALMKLEDIEMANFFTSLKLLLKDKKWVLGTILGMLGGIPYTLAVQWTGVSIVQPLMSFGFIVLVFAAKRYLGEDLNWSAKFSILLMILMPILIGAGNVSNATKDITLAKTQVYLTIYTISILMAALILFGLSKRFPFLIALVNSCLFATGALLGQGAISYLTFSGYTLEKDLFYIIFHIFSDPNLINVFYFFLGSLITNGLAAMVMQIGLQKIAASKFNPIQQTFNTLLTIMGGIVIYGQMVSVWGLYIAGLTCASVGTLILGTYQIPAAVEGEDNEPGERAKTLMNTPLELEIQAKNTTDLEEKV